MEAYSLESEAKRTGKFSIRCQNTVKRKKDGKMVKCNHFVSELDDFQIVVNCHKCGTPHSIFKDDKGDYKIFYNPKTRQLIKSKEVNK